MCTQILSIKDYMKYTNTTFRLSFIAVLLGVAGALSAQNLLNSPLSRFGIGELASPYNHSLYNMGGISAGYYDIYKMNLENPASLAYLNSTSFQAGVHARKNWIDDGSNKSDYWTGNLDYLSLGFPIFNPINSALDRKERQFHWGMAIGLKPFSKVGYGIQTIDSIPEIGNVKSDFVGKGGTNLLSFHNGFRYKNFAAGVTAGALFGQLEYTRTTEFLDLLNSNDNKFEDDIQINAFYLNLGVQYHYTLNKDAMEKDQNIPARVLSLGVSYRPQLNITTDYQRFYRSINEITGSDASGRAVDTLQYDESPVIGDGTLPQSISAGLYYTDNKNWAGGLQYRLESWSDFEMDAISNEKLKDLGDQYSMSLGVRYRPDQGVFNNFLRRLYYKGGIRVGQSMFKSNGESLKEFGAQLGVSMPFFFQRQISFVDLGVEYGSRGLSTNLEERYIQLSVGFTLNDNSWFIKRKFN